MNIILVIIAIITVGLIFYIARVRAFESDKIDKPTERSHVPPVTCCGAHETCEAESLLAMSDEIIYYDDEDLDRFAGNGPDDYDDEAVDEFRDVLMTLQTHEVAGWLRSLVLRKIEPPTAVREEALMIVSEFRDERRNSHA